jgi:hypothetical protein
LRHTWCHEMAHRLRIIVWAIACLSSHPHLDFIFLVSFSLISQLSSFLLFRLLLVGPGKSCSKLRTDFPSFPWATYITSSFWSVDKLAFVRFEGCYGKLVGIGVPGSNAGAYRSTPTYCLHTTFKLCAHWIGSARLGTAQPGSDQANVRPLLQNLSVPETRGAGLAQAV